MFSEQCDPYNKAGPSDYSSVMHVKQCMATYNRECIQTYADNKQPTCVDM